MQANYSQINEVWRPRNSANARVADGGMGLEPGGDHRQGREPLIEGVEQFLHQDGVLTVETEAAVELLP